MKKRTMPQPISATQRLHEEYAKLKRNGEYNAGKEAWAAAVCEQLAKMGKTIDSATFAEIVHAARVATTPCDRCNASGIYQWGAQINGRMTHSASCYRCNGKGRQNQDDYRRNWGYDQRIKAV